MSDVSDCVREIPVEAPGDGPRRALACRDIPDGRDLDGECSRATLIRTSITALDRDHPWRRSYLQRQWRAVG